MEPRIDDRITTIVGAYKTILTPARKETVADAVCSGAWVNQNPRHVRRTGRDGNTPGDTGMSVRSKQSPPPVMIGSHTIYPSCGISGSLQVGKKRQSTSPDEVGNAQKWDTIIDKKLRNDRYYAPFFSKVIGHELYHGSSNDLYLRCRMNFLSNVVQTEALQLVDLGILAIKTSYELSVLNTPATRIRRLTDRYHWTAPDHVFDEAIAVGMSTGRSEQDYNYKTGF